MNVSEKRVICSDGYHNAFTDIKFFNGRYYLVFRKGKTHGSYDGCIMLSVSSDGEKWDPPVKIIDTPRDDRDPKLFIFNSKLFCLIQSRWSSKEDYSRRIPMVAYSEDGRNWSEPVQCYDLDYVPWRAKIYQGTLYNALYISIHKASRRDPSSWNTVLCTSTNGLWWNYMSTIYEGDCANETEIHFLNNDALIALVRRERRSSVLAWSKSPFQEWQYKDLGVAIHSPCILEVKDKILISGREYNYEANTMGVSLWLYKDESKTLEKIIEIEPMASISISETEQRLDCGYPGMQKIVNSDNSILFSYYHGNSVSSNVYVRRIEI